MSTRYSSLNRIARNIFIIFVLLLLLLHPSGTARAANFTVGTFAELQAAIYNANDEDQNPGPDTITLIADITFPSPSPALDPINSQITIEGAKHTLDGVSLYRVLSVSSNGTLTINNLTIANGYVSNSDGGGMYNSGTVTITNSTFSGNSAVRVTTGGGGGGIYNNGTMTINNSTFSGNQARIGGGIKNHGTLTINNCTFSSNTAINLGGGIQSDPSRVLNIYNSTFSGNSAGSNNGGGGIRNEGTINYARNIIANSIAGDDCYNIGIISTNSYSLVENGSTCNPSYTSDPALNPLADNGGPTQTHALQSTSPAIDIVPNGTSTGGIDQRSAARDYDGNNTSSGNEGDLGAYEFHQSILNGTCSGPELSGTQTFTFASGNTVTIIVSIPNGLNCITVEEMGPGADHLMATGPGSGGETLHTNNWWHISGNATTGFTVSITLPYATPDGYTRVCKWPGNLGGAGWDCDPANTSSGPGTSVTRANITSFSDWAVGQGVGPTAVTLINFSAHSSDPWAGASLAISVLVAGFLITLLLVRIRKQAHG
jgi:hypothetical protein